MRIGELAAASGLTTKTLRYYEAAGVLGEPPRSAAGYRDYDDTAPHRLRFVRSAQAAGLTLAEIRQVIAVRENTGPPCVHVTELLARHLHELEVRITELHAMRDDVQHLIERARTLDPQRCSPEGVCHVIPAIA